VTATSTSSVSPRSVTATCPVGKTAISGTAQLSPTNLTIALLGSYQTAAGNWIAEARETSNTGSNWTITATAICVNVIP
jgi:hypothetical protein